MTHANMLHAAAVALLVALGGVQAEGQAKTITLAWDYAGVAPAVVATYAQAVTVDGAAATAPIACQVHPTRPADTTCAIVLPTLAPGAHTVAVSATLNGHAATTSITGLDLAKVPTSATAPRLNITITIAFP